MEPPSSDHWDYSSTTFLNDFDRIVAGAIAVNFNNLTSAQAKYRNLTGNSTSPEFVHSALRSMIHQETSTYNGGLDKYIDLPSRILTDADSTSGRCFIPVDSQPTVSILSSSDRRERSSPLKTPYGNSSNAARK